MNESAKASAARAMESRDSRSLNGREFGPNKPFFGMTQTPPRMDVKFPILGFLRESEATGYDLKRRFQNPVGFFYRVSDGSIYPALKKLAREGLVTMRNERQGRRARKVYAITPKGRQHFARMLREPAQPLFVFDEAQVKIYFAEHDPAAALEHMERLLHDDQHRAEFLAGVVNQMERAGESLVRRSVVELGRAITQAKAQVLAKLCGQLKREISHQSRVGRRVDALRAAVSK
jgi:DNA-binding PadR family transcriptional regulator